MNYNLHGDGSGPLGAMLILLFLALVSFICGILLFYFNTGRGRNIGFYMIVFAIVLGIIAALIYSSVRYSLW